MPEGSTWYLVFLDGGSHGCWLKEDEPPEPGQERMLGEVFARVDDVIETPVGEPPLSAVRAKESGLTVVGQVRAPTFALVRPRPAALNARAD